MKQRVVASSEEADALEASVLRAAATVARKLEVPAASDIGRLWELKIGSFGSDPLSPDRSLNFIEQLNQSFTYIATARALRYLLGHFPDLGPFSVNMGTAPGPDITARIPSELAAEVFAATSPGSNRKLVKDLAKVAAFPASRRFVFLMCPGIAEGRIERLERSGVVVWSVGGSA